MTTSVDWDLPCFESLDEAIEYVAKAGGGIVYWPGLAELDLTTAYSRMLIDTAKKRGVELHAERLES